MLGQRHGDDRTQALRAPRLAPVRRRRGRAEAQVDRLRARRPAAAEPGARRAAALRRHDRARACASTASGSSARARSCAASTSSSPSRRCCRAPGSATYAQVLEAERWGDEVLQSVPRRVLDVAFLRDPARDGQLRRRRQAAAARRADAPGAAADRAPDGDEEQGARRRGARRPRRAARPARPHRRLDRRRPARRRAAQRRRPADRQHDPPAADARRPAPADRRSARAPGSCATSRRASAKSRRACCPPSGSPERRHGRRRAAEQQPACGARHTASTSSHGDARHAVGARRYSRPTVAPTRSRPAPCASSTLNPSASTSIGSTAPPGGCAARARTPRISCRRHSPGCSRARA